MSASGRNSRCSEPKNHVRFTSASTCHTKPGAVSSHANTDHCACGAVWGPTYIGMQRFEAGIDRQSRSAPLPVQLVASPHATCI